MKARARRLSISSRRVRIPAALLAGLATAGCVGALDTGVPPAWAAPTTGAAAAVRGRVLPPPPAPPVLSNLVPREPAGEPAPATQSPADPLAPAPQFTPLPLPGPMPGPGTSGEDAGGKRYSVVPGVTLPPVVKEKVNRIAEIYWRRTGKDLVITSGTRDAAAQAEAMHELFRLGADVTTLYRNKVALKEIKRAYDETRATARPTAAVVAAMAEVIKRQMDRGVFISAHLRAGAVDIRNRDMSVTEKRALVSAVSEVGGVTALEESRPPHYHLQVD